MLTIKHDAPAQTDKEVTARLKDGWMLHGMLHVVECSGNLYYIQALVKVEPMVMKMPPGFNDDSGLLIPRPRV